MYLQTGLFFYKFRFVFASVLTAAFLVFISAIVTAVGSDSILNAKVSSSETTLGANLSDSSDAVTVAAYGIVNGAQRAVLSIGTTLYATCRSITAMTVASGQTAARGSAAALHGVWYGVAFTGRMAGDSIMLTLRTPGQIASSVGSGSRSAVSSIIQPSSADASPVPVITAPSAAMLAQMSEQERQEIASLQAAQIAANRNLDGTIVAGDPNHGGYPARWDNAPQDSSLDSWGMYNRECVSYAAWKVYQTYGSMPYWGGVGNANEWVRDARAAGIATGSVPQVHSVAISMRGYYGHAMWVEAVKDDMVYVSQYNYDLHGHYSEMWVKSSYFTYIYFK